MSGQVNEEALVEVIAQAIADAQRHVGPYGTGPVGRRKPNVGHRYKAREILAALTAHGYGSLDVDALAAENRQLREALGDLRRDFIRVKQIADQHAALEAPPGRRS